MLDIGAGPNWAWTDLAAKLVRTKEGHHRGMGFWDIV